MGVFSTHRRDINYLKNAITYFHEFVIQTYVKKAAAFNNQAWSIEIQGWG